MASEDQNEDLNHHDKTPVTLERWMIQAAFDLVVNSMDFGSGFLSEEDVIAMRALAVAIGVDPTLATPGSEHAEYGDPCELFPIDVGSQRHPEGTMVCRLCSKTYPPTPPSPPPPGELGE